MSNPKNELVREWLRKSQNDLDSAYLLGYGEKPGTHKAVQLFREYSFKNYYVLKCDIKKYFPSIDHEILKSLIRKKIKCKDTLWLIDLILDNSNPQEIVNFYFNGDSLFTPYQRKRGLPIGNLTSQFFANVYLNELDHFVKERLRCKYYMRYVDDFVLFSNEKEELQLWLNQIHTFLISLRLKLHENKAKIHKTSSGVKFLGYKIFPYCIHLKTENIQRFLKRMKTYRIELKQNKVQFLKIKQSLASWNGYAKLSHSTEFRERLLCNLF